MIDKDLVYRKLARLNMYLDQLKPIAGKSLAEYLSDIVSKAAAERFIQLIVECASDINNHAVVESGKRPPEDYTSSFVRAAEVGLISRELAERLKGSGGMRNILVHEYMDIDDEKVYKTLPIALKDYKEYLKQVNAFLGN
jgi:uncharacterized protein YutE (UPF0331/DUF86 family)